MSMPNSGDVTVWTITNQVERDQLVPGSAPVRGVQIFYTTGRGNSGSVFVPYSQYTSTSQVKAAIQAAAAQMDAVSMLQGTGI